MKTNKKKGFTLGELLIVVAIIAVLVAISIPIFTNHLERARRAVDLSNARNIKFILMASYAGGTITFPFAQEKVDEAGLPPSVDTCVAVVVNRDGVDFRSSGTVLIDGGDWKSDNGTAYQRVKKLFASVSFDNLYVHAKTTSNDGWASYCVVLFSDGSCRILSSKDKINLGGSSAGVFENNLAKLLTESSTGIEKAMGAN